MFEYFYNGILEKTINAFGNLFNEIQIVKRNQSGNITSVLNVPISYGPTQKFLARLEQSPDLNRPFQMVLPRMSFQMTGLSYDPKRKTTITQTFLSRDTDNNVRKAYMPVPYDVDFDLSIMTKTSYDMFQILEQILPYFQPSYNVTIDLVDDIGEKRDIPIIFNNNIEMSDDYEGDFTKIRYLTYTLKFTAKTYIFGPISSAEKTNSQTIKKVSIGFISGDKTKSPERELVYTLTPKAIKSYVNNSVTSILEDIDVNVTKISVENSSEIPINSYIVINDETMLVKSKNNNMLIVERGKYNTNKLFHVSGSEVQLITSDDDVRIQIGDNFAYNEETIS